MSEMDDDELLSTRLYNGSYKIDDLLNYWRLTYEIPLFEIDKVREYIKELEREVKKK